MCNSECKKEDEWYFERIHRQTPCAFFRIMKSTFEYLKAHLEFGALHIIYLVSR